MALAYLFGSPDADLVGIASTAGNVPVQQVCQNNLGLLELCRVDGIPVSKGSEQPVSSPLRTAEDTHGPQGLGYATLPSTDRLLTAHDAAQAWITAAHAYPGELIGAGDRPADQPGAGASAGTHAAHTAATVGHHGRRIRIPRKHDTGRGVEHQRGPRGRTGGFRGLVCRMGSGPAATSADRVGAEPDREHRDDACAAGTACDGGATPRPRR